MTPATTWTEQTADGDNWQESGFVAPGSTPVRVLFGAIVFNQLPFQAQIATTYTEQSVAATSYTEASVAATSWTEVSG